MKNEKATRAMGYIDDELVLSAMNDSDLGGESAKGHAERKNRKMKNNLWKKWIAAAAVFLLMLSVGIVAVTMSNAPASATIALDVNPSIEIEVDKNEKVSAVSALNPDAETVIGEMNLVGVEIDVAMNAIIGSMLKNGYLSIEQNSILVSIDSKSDSTSKSLQKKISNEINTLLQNNNIDASVITQNFKDNSEIEKIATENNISTAKASLISKIISAELLDANGVPYTTETLAHLNVNELKLILESKSLNVSGITSTGTASSKGYISKEEAFAIALAKAGVSEESITYKKTEFDFELALFSIVYEIEFVANDVKYEFEIHAKNGEILQAETETYGGESGNIAAPSDAITREAALEIAYLDAGVSKDSVKRPEIELDREGKTYVYEIEFKSGGMEYEYTINAKTGKIIEREKEPID